MTKSNFTNFNQWNTDSQNTTQKVERMNIHKDFNLLAFPYIKK